MRNSVLISALLYLVLTLRKNKKGAFRLGSNRSWPLRTAEIGCALLRQSPSAAVVLRCRKYLVSIPIYPLPFRLGRIEGF